MSLRAKHHHESIEVQSGNQRLKVVRQDRKDVEGLDCFIDFNGHQLKVSNISAFGVLVATAKYSLPIEVEAPLVVEGVELGMLKMKQVRVHKGDDVNSELTAFEIVGEPFDVARINAVEEAKKIMESSNDYQGATKRIPDLFARKVYEVKDWLEDLQMKINKIENNKANYEVLSQHEFEQAFVQIMGDYFNKVMPIKNKDLGEYIKDYNANVIKDCYEFFREKLKLLIYQAPFSDRVFNKPLGYAGDYEMMNIIYRSQPEGASLFAKCLHDYWVKQPAAQAVRNRAQYMKSKIKKMVTENQGKELRFLSVACGPAKEWQELIIEGAFSDANITVDLLDQDEHALKHAQKQMKELGRKFGSNIKFNFVHKAIKNVIVKGLEEKYDMVYSAGLFDYFSDPVAQVAASKLYETLKHGGQLIIGNFNVENPNSIVMDLALDWHLIYRSKLDLEKLFSHIGDLYGLEYEGLGINLFCVLSKKQWN